MALRRKSSRTVQAWIVLRADDPEAVSALGAARAWLDSGRGLASLRRLRLFELQGRLPGRDELETLLHRSTQFYNPAKESCVLRFEPADPTPAGPGEEALLVWERGGERRPAAERWWHHETGQRIEVREGVAWLLRSGNPGQTHADAASLAVLRDRRHGLLCNPHAQEHRAAGATVPMPWWAVAGEETR